MFKKILKFVSVVLIFSILFLCLGCTQEDDDDEIHIIDIPQIKLSMSFEGVATSDDIDESAAFPTLDFKYTTKNYYLAKFHCILENGSKYTLSSVEEKRFKCEDYIVKKWCIGIHPSVQIFDKTNEEFDIFIYMNKKYDTKEKVLSAISKHGVAIKGIAWNDRDYSSYAGHFILKAEINPE